MGYKGTLSTIETGGKWAGHNLWKNDIAWGPNINRWQTNQLRQGFDPLILSISVICTVVSNSLRPHGPPGSSVHGVLQAKNTGWVTQSFLQRIFLTQDQTWVSCISGRFFTIWATKRVKWHAQRHQDSSKANHQRPKSEWWPNSWKSPLPSPNSWNNLPTH